MHIISKKHQREFFDFYDNPEVHSLSDKNPLKKIEDIVIEGQEYTGQNVDTDYTDYDEYLLEFIKNGHPHRHLIAFALLTSSTSFGEDLYYVAPYLMPYTDINMIKAITDFYNYINHDASVKYSYGFGSYLTEAIKYKKDEIVQFLKDNNVQNSSCFKDSTLVNVDYDTQQRWWEKIKEVVDGDYSHN